jgi:hypothetical protein
MEQATADDRIVGQHGGLALAGPRRMPPDDNPATANCRPDGVTVPGRAAARPVSRFPLPAGDFEISVSRHRFATSAVRHYRVHRTCGAELAERAVFEAHLLRCSKKSTRFDHRDHVGKGVFRLDHLPLTIGAVPQLISVM